MSKNPDKVKQGKRNRANGAAHELRVRKDLEEKGWIVDKWSNNVELPEIDVIMGTECQIGRGKLSPAKRKYAGPGRPMVIGTGFPDFIAIKRRPASFGAGGFGAGGFGNINTDCPSTSGKWEYAVIGVECKCNGNLDKVEREKCRWLLDNNKFSKILIAEKTKVKNKIVIVYHDFEEKYGK
ncbi:MAG: hypothetical protein ACTSQH_00065 [Candidatus Hodarchaeales archaeon]